MAYNYMNNQPQQNFAQFQTPQMFPQPNGNIYSINSSNELTNIPVGVGLSAALCLSENMLYLKSIQNGNPVIWSYRLSTGEQELNKTESTTNNTTSIKQEVDYTGYIRALEEKYVSMEERLKKVEQQWEEKF